MPNEPLLSLAIDDLSDALRQIRAANGFFTELGNAVEDELADVARHGSGPAGVVVGIESVSSTDVAETALEQVVVLLTAWHSYQRPTPEGGLTPRQIAARVARDLEAALKVDYTRGGLCADTVPIGWSPTPDPAEGAIVWVTFRVRLTLVRAYGDASEAIAESEGQLA